jgi:hypothetical protein
VFQVNARLASSIQLEHFSSIKNGKYSSNDETIDTVTNQFPLINQCINQFGNDLYYSIMSDAVEDAYIISTYMKKRLPFVLLRALGDMDRPESPDDQIPHPHHWSLEFAMEVDLALDVITRAFHNQGLGYFDLPDYYLIDFNSFNALGCKTIC